MTTIKPDQVSSQLDKILASPEFKGSKRLCQFLRYVVEETLDGRSESIKQYTVAVEALEYGPEFDPQANPTVRILAGRLRRALDQYYFNGGVEDPVRIDIPRGSYVPIIREINRVSEPSGPAVTPSTDSEQKSAETSKPTVAVVMFENLDNINNNIFFAKGMTSQLIVSLSRFTELSVLGPLNKLEDQPNELYRLFHDYGALFVLQGGIRSHGSKVRITTDLTDTTKGSKLWGRTFEYDLEKTSLFEIEDEVTSNIAGEIAGDLGIIFRKLLSLPHSKYITVSNIAKAVLAYNYAWITHAPSDWEKANQTVEKALEIHPENALLIALQSNIYYADVLHELNIVPDSLEKMEGLALKAVSLDPELQVAQYNLVVQNAFWNRPKKCLEAAEKAVGLNKNHARILAGTAIATTSVGAYNTGLEYIERAKRLNPHYPSFYHFVEYLVYFGNEEYEKAWDEARKLHIEGMLWHSLLRAAILGKLNRTKVAEPYIDELLRIKPEFPKHPMEYIRRLFVTDKHVEMILDGLCKAGMSHT